MNQAKQSYHPGSAGGVFTRYVEGPGLMGRKRRSLALPGAPLSVTSFHHTFAKGAAECCTPELVWAWSTAGLAAHTSLPCPDALLPGETRGSLRPAGDWHSGTETPAGDDGSGHLARDWAATFPPQTSGSAESKKWGC